MRLRVLRLFLASAILAGAFVAWDVHTPARVSWETVELQGGPADRADGLVLQHERGDDVFASQGWSIYRSRAGGDFEKIHTLLPRVGEAWAGFSRLLRRRFGYQELVEVVPLGGDALVVFGGGDVYRVELASGRNERVHTLRYFGRGKGRGVMPHGLTVTADGTIYYGEYTTLLGGPAYTVRIWRGEDGGRRWSTAYEFAPGEVRHVHAVQLDPVDDALWVATGDTNPESRVGRSTDAAKSFEWIGQGSQQFRLCSLLFFPALVAWGTDADRSQNHFLRWHRQGSRVEVTSALLPSPTYYAEALAPDLGLLASMEQGAAVFAVTPDGTPRPIVAWTVPDTPLGRPHPGVRLARQGPGEVARRDSFLVNPIRTVEEEAAIFRMPISRARTAVGH